MPIIADAAVQPVPPRAMDQDGLSETKSVQTLHCFFKTSFVLFEPDVLLYIGVHTAHV